MRKSVTPHTGAWNGEHVSLYGLNGTRKYLNRSERSRALKAMAELQVRHSLFALVLAWTGARVSEILALTPRSFQIESGLVTIVTLKRRRFAVREVPIPPALMASLDRVFGLRRLQLSEQSARTRLWSFCRMTAWRIIKRAMGAARIIGPHACPKGLRHAFGVCALQASVPLTLVQKWMGHARLSTTAIYLEVCGPEEISFAERWWQVSAPHHCSGAQWV